MFTLSLFYYWDGTLSAISLYSILYSLLPNSIFTKWILTKLGFKPLKIINMIGKQILSSFTPLLEGRSISSLLAQLYFYPIDINQIWNFRLSEGLNIISYQMLETFNPINPASEGRIVLTLFGLARLSSYRFHQAQKVISLKTWNLFGNTNLSHFIPLTLFLEHWAFLHLIILPWLNNFWASFMEIVGKKFKICYQQAQLGFRQTSDLLEDFRI